MLLNRALRGSHAYEVRDEVRVVKLYKVTKIRKTPVWDGTTHVRTQVDYRIRKGDVMLAVKSAEKSNLGSDRFKKMYPEARPTRYEVQVEVADLPVFQPMTVCEHHGLQEMANVPGLTSDFTCVECI